MLAITIVLFAGIGLAAAAQNSTTSIFFPIVDAQPLVGSVVKEDHDIKTLVIRCPDGTDPTKCGFPTPVTVTAGPTTLALTTVVADSMTVDLKCAIKGSTHAECTQTYTGPLSLYTSDSGSSGDKITIWSASQTLESSKITYLPVTITANTGSEGAAAYATPTAGVGHIIAAGVIAQIAAMII